MVLAHHLWVQFQPALGKFTNILLILKRAKNKYSITDLRTIQDWIVKRQLSGIKGVVEVNTWGGYLKEYEVAINPQQLQAVNLTLFDVYYSFKEE